MRAPQPTDAAAKRQASYAGGRHDATGGRQAKGLRLPVEFAPGQTWFGAHSGPGGVYADALHGRQVDHQATVAHAVAGRTVAAAADGQGQAVVARKVNRADDVGGTSATYDQRRVAVDHAVPDHARRIETVLAGPQHAAS